VQVVSGTLTTTFAYNGDGVLVAQTVDGVETTFVQDVGGPLSQILVETSGGSTERHLYGALGVLAWTEGGAWVYPLKDALGSVRQLTDEDGQVDEVAGYSPFGMPDDSDLNTPHGYTGERWYGGAGLLYLRVRHYYPTTGRFISADTIVPDLTNPQMLNRYAYVLGNPLKYTDPTGHISQEESQKATEIVQGLQNSFGVIITIDWGFTDDCVWEEGNWTNIQELETVEQAVLDLANAMRGGNKFRANLGEVQVIRGDPRHGNEGTAHKVWLASIAGEWGVVHELAHAWDGANNWKLSRDLKKAMGATEHPLHFLVWIVGDSLPKRFWYNPGAGPPAAGINAWTDRKEDFAESVTAFVYPDEAKVTAAKRGFEYGDASRWGRAYSHFHETPRGHYIATLLGWGQ